MYIILRLRLQLKNIVESVKINSTKKRTTTTKAASIGVAGWGLKALAA